MRLKREREKERERKARYYNLIRKARIVEGQSEMKRVERSWAGETYWRGKGERVDLKAMHPLVDIFEKQMDIAMDPRKKIKGWRIMSVLYIENRENVATK